MRPCGRRQERRGGEAVEYRLRQRRGVTDGPDPVLALAAVAELRSVAHPNR